MENNAYNDQRAKITVLFIDDNYSQYLDTLTLVADSFGYKVQAFCSVKEGLAFLDENLINVGAVILDIFFPRDDIQGIDALSKIRSQYYLLPVIMLTDGDSEKDIEIVVDCMKKGATYYVSKLKLNPIYLFQVIKSAFQQYHLNLEIERQKVLKEEYRNKISVYEKMLYTTEMILKNILRDKLYFPPTFEKRIKTFKSFYEKLKSKEKFEGFIAEPFKRITDISGLRIIFYNAVDLQKAVDAIKRVNDFWDFKTACFPLADDKSNSNGYRAVNFDVVLNEKKRLKLEEYEMLSNIPCEVQLRTIFAHAWSEVQHAMSYKKNDGLKLSEEEKQKLDDDFREAANKLESIEIQITNLCAKYYPRIE